MCVSEGIIPSCMFQLGFLMSLPVETVWELRSRAIFRSTDLLKKASHCFLRSLGLWKCASEFCLAIHWYWESCFRVSLPVFRPFRIRLPSCFSSRFASGMVFPNLSIGWFRFEILSPNVDSGRWSLDIVPPIFPLRSSSSKRVSAFPFR